jgi:hypothetical protein
VPSEADYDHKQGTDSADIMFCLGRLQGSSVGRAHLP